MPAIEAVPIERGYGSAAKRGFTFRLAAGADPATIRFGNLGYADAALESFADFDTRQKAGDIPAHIRFQVALPSPVSPVLLWFLPEAQAVLVGVGNRLHQVEGLDLLLCQVRQVVVRVGPFDFFTAFMP